MSILAVAALGAVLASSAFATATTTAANWYTGTTAGGVTVLSGSQTLTATLSGTATFATEISGQEVEVRATGVECVSCQISNSPTGGTGSGKLKFTGLTAVKPVCPVPASVTTNALTFSADYMEGTTAMMHIAPTAGLTSEFVGFTISCVPPLEFRAKGDVFGKDANATGVMATTQSLGFSLPINETAGGILRNGTSLASLTGTLVFKAGGLFFGVK